jgi:hypothetical protein
VDSNLLAAIVVVISAYAAFCFRVFDKFGEDGEALLIAHYGSQAGQQQAILEQVLAVTLPELMDLYLRLEVAPDASPLTAPQLRSASTKLRASPDEEGLYGHELVTTPTLKFVTPRVVQSLPRLSAALVSLDPVIEGLLGLRCYSVDLDRERSRIDNVVRMYALQAIICGIWLAALLASAVAVVPAGPALTLAIGMLLTLPGGLMVELSRYRVKRRLRVRPSAANLMKL